MSDKRLSLRRWPRASTRRVRASLQALWHRHQPISPGSLVHTLPGKLVVSLTSYPPRFATLDLTLRSLLAQDVAPVAVVLWIAHRDMAQLPQRVRALERHGLTIRGCDDTRSYKKILPALTAYPGAFIVIAGDDMAYPASWLRRFCEEYRHPGEVLCQVARRMAIGEDGMPMRHADWPHVLDDAPDARVVPVGCGGVLYPPGALPPAASDARFRQLCPEGDDLWLWWHFTSAGELARRIAPAGLLDPRHGTQDAGLWRRKKHGGNDRAGRGADRRLRLACIRAPGRRATCDDSLTSSTRCGSWAWHSVWRKCS